MYVESNFGHTLVSKHTPIRGEGGLVPPASNNIHLHQVEPSAFTLTDPYSLYKRYVTT
jgi:hypothetical protein